MKREYKATEFWALVLMVAAWLLDRYFGAGLLDNIDLAAVDSAKAEVLKLAADLRGDGGNSSILVIVGLVVYMGRKAEKIITNSRQ